MRHKQQIAVLMGPTGTGKSALALAVAKARPTVIINADAMQMVADLRVITARPTEQEENEAEHALYGVLPAQEPTSVARWLELVVPIIKRAWAEEKLPMLVGGTGMYIKALRDGLVDTPAIPDEVRAQARSMDSVQLYDALRARHAEGNFKPGDTQRLRRAWEVLEVTGKTIGWWQAQKQESALPHAEWKCAYLAMPRDRLYARLNARFAAMLDQGAMDEVRALVTRKLPADTPVLRAHGVPELAAYLAGSMELAQAIDKAQQNTRNYAKRQMTWLRHRAGEAQALDAVEGANFYKN